MPACWHPCCLTTPASNHLIQTTCSPFAQSMAIRLGVFEHDPTSRFTAWIQPRNHSRSAPDGVLLASGGTGKFLVCTQPLRALCTGTQLYQRLIEAGSLKQNRRHHGMAAMGNATVPATGSHPPKPCRFGPEQGWSTCARVAVFSASTPL